MMKTLNSILMILITCFLAACQGLSNGINTPPAIATAAIPDDLPEVLGACAPEVQVAAMRPDQIPAWESLEITACYRLSLDLQPAQGSYTGQAQVTFTNLTDVPLPDIVFRTYPNASLIYGGELAVTAASIDDQVITPEVFLEDRTAIRLSLPAPLAPGASALVDLSFTGQAPVDFGGLPDVYGIFNFDQDAQVLTLANWYPLLAIWRSGAWQVDPVIGEGDAVVSETGLYQVNITLPDGWQVVTSGTSVGETDEGKNIRWEFASGPMRDFMVVASPNFIETQTEYDGIRIRHWGLAGGKARWPEALQATIDSLTIYENRFGPYPYAELDIVATPMKNAAGVEYPGVFLILDTLYRPNQDRPFLLGLVVAHEAAHQWWYGLVGNDVLADPWQDEGLTTFSSLVYQEAYQPDYYPGTLAFYQQAVDGISTDGVGIDIDQPVSAFLGQANAYGTIVYDGGAVFFETLRQRIGDKNFFRGLQEYYTENRYKLADPESLLTAFETACACDLNDFYASWGVDRGTSVQ